MKGATDLAFIRAFCQKLGKQDYLRQLNAAIYPYEIGGNDIGRAKKHFSALKQHLPHLKGFALFDKLGRGFKDVPDGLKMYQWQRQEIENYIPIPSTLMNCINAQSHDLFFARPSRKIRAYSERKYTACCL